jgi:DNA-binding LytR/AlgR family response regulator
MNPFIHPHTLTGTLTILRGSVHLRIADIVRLEADRNYTRIILTNGQVFLTSKSLSFYAPLLPDGFVRVHKSHLLNSRYICTVSKYDVQMYNGFVAQVSRRKRKTANNIQVNN